jgi:large subunit ribosomal protein L17
VHEARSRRLQAGRVTAHRWALFRNLLVALFRHERIMTTEAKAVLSLAEQMVTLAKRESLHARRQVLAMVPGAEVVRKLFDTIAARYAERRGGYTRILRAGTRGGDRAPMVLLELVDRPEAPRAKGKKAAKAPGARPGAAAGRGAGRRKLPRPGRARRRDRSREGALHHPPRFRVQETERRAGDTARHAIAADAAGAGPARILQRDA